MSDHKELYFAPTWAPQNDLQWLETQLNAQSLQFMIDCLPEIHDAIARCWAGTPLKVLDVGTASGAGANLLGNLYAGGMLGYQIEVDALELTSSLAAYAKANYPFINYITADALDLPPTPNWDIVLCSHTLEHVERPADFLHHLQYLARSRVLIYTPYNEIDQIEGHINTIDDPFLAAVGAESKRIVTSPAWRPGLSCVIFSVPGLPLAETIKRRGRPGKAGIETVIVPDTAAHTGVSYEDRIANELQNHSGVFHQHASSEELERCMPTIPAFNYALELYGPYLVSKMPSVAIDPHVLDVIRKAQHPVRLLSLGCATGDWEMAIARNYPQKCNLTLVDLNPELLAEAAAFGRKHDIEVRIEPRDVNSYNITPGYYDFIVCRSSLHHFMMLERVLNEIRNGLADHGELLVIGESIGRKGLQIYPETEKIANDLFRALPARLRKNYYTGEVDTAIPNIDHSADCFEAVRSEEILPMLLEVFRPVEYVAYDSLVTLFFDFRYGRNYNLEDANDRQIIQRITALDADYVGRNVLRPTALFGRFKR
jgi:2-polyprenyl-3-methyl-5-hydroxy-6-metoxy-1,4-benzoquinol methylase